MRAASMAVVAAADDRNLVADFYLLAEIDFAQEFNRAPDAGKVFALDIKRPALVRARCKHDDVIVAFRSVSKLISRPTRQLVLISTPRAAISSISA